MSFGLTLDKLLIILILALLLIGPERLPAMARKLGEWTRALKGFVTGAKDRMRDEVGPEFDEIDWKQLDPRQYDPRRIIRDALRDEPAPPPVRETAYAQRQRMLREGRQAPFDTEAT